MSEQSDPAHDPRSVDELFLFALTEVDPCEQWDAIGALHYRGTREVLERAHSLCFSDCSFERRIGADVLGQLGVMERTFPRECCETLIALLRGERDETVTEAALIALSHHHWSEAIPAILPFAEHSNADVRYAAVLALTGYEGQSAVDALIRLSGDHDEDVRDWATFGLGTQCDLDTPPIRDALAARLSDPHDDTRAEAIAGLARRDDPRAIDAIQRELTSDCVGMLVLEAAEACHSPELLPFLLPLRDWNDMDRVLLESAIAACSKSTSAICRT